MIARPELGFKFGFRIGFDSIRFDWIRFSTASNWPDKNRRNGDHSANSDNKSTFVWFEFEFGFSFALRSALELQASTRSIHHVGAFQYSAADLRSLWARTSSWLMANERAGRSQNFQVGSNRLAGQQTSRSERKWICSRSLICGLGSRISDLGSRISLSLPSLGSSFGGGGADKSHTLGLQTSLGRRATSKQQAANKRANKQTALVELSLRPVVGLADEAAKLGRSSIAFFEGRLRLRSRTGSREFDEPSGRGEGAAR